MDILIKTDTQHLSWGNVCNAFRKKHQNATTFVPEYGEESKSICVEKLLQYLHDNTWKESYMYQVAADALGILRIFMRERIAIENLLTVEAMNFFLSMAEQDFIKSSKEKNSISATFEDIWIESLKCAINSVYERPNFVEEYIKRSGMKRMVNLLKLPRVASFHFLSTKLLVYATGNSMIAIECLKQKDSMLLNTIIPTMSFMVWTSIPSFPKGKDRLGTLIQMLQLLFTLASSGNAISQEIESEKMMTQLGFLLTELIMYPSNTTEIFELQSHVVNCLLYMPEKYCNYLVERNAVLSLVEHLKKNVDLITIEKTRSPQQMTPLLIVLNKLASSNIQAKKQIKEAIFPEVEEEKLILKRDAQIKMDMQRTMEAKSEDEQLRIKQEISDRKMHPEDAPKNTFRGKLLRFMTSIESTSKRYTSELLFTLCDENVKEFTIRTGMGNAIALLKLKGLF